jgi:hypothetical protein
VTVWKTIPDYVNYEVSDEGQVRGLKRGRVLDPKPDRSGYKLVCLSNELGLKRLLIHRLVASVFLPRQEGCDVVHHKDSNRSNNCATNLEWTTQKNNVQASRGYAKPRRAEQPLPDDTGRLVSLGSIQELGGRFSKYAVSEKGFVVSSAGARPRVLHTYDIGDSYRCVILSDGGATTSMKVHRLVALAFCSGRTEDRNYVNHIDQDRTNNHHSNLEWCSSSENRNHRSHVQSALEDIKQDLKIGIKHEEISSKHGVTASTVSRIAAANNLKRDNRIPEDIRSLVLEDLRSELTAAKVAAKYSIGINTVLKMAKDNGVKPIGRRLLASTREQIASLLASGMSQAKVAQAMSVDRGTVSLIARG